MRPRSLTLRIFAYLILSQTLAALAAFALIVALFLTFEEFDFELSDLAYVRAKDFVEHSLVRGSSGNLTIAPNEDLQALLSGNRSLKYAVFNETYETALEGSSPEIVAAFRGVSALKLRYADFTLSDATEGLRGTSSKEATPYGVYYVAIHGYRFQPTDFFYFFRSYLKQTGAYFLTSIAAATLASWFAIRQGLSPLRGISEQAARIDLASLREGLEIGNAPLEMRPLVDAINSALARVDASVARMRRFTANAAHELRTPLAIMRARLESADWPPRKGDMLRDANRMQALIDQMLISSRLLEGQILRDQQVDLVEAVSEIIADYTPLAIESDRRIELKPSARPVFVRGNRRAIECVVTNLIGNALRAEPLHGNVIVRIGADAVVTVTDHGEGVAEAHRELIFEPFWRKSETPTGAGLGLAIAKEIMDAHGGRIWVEETDGGGATFKLSFSTAVSI